MPKRNVVILVATVVACIVAWAARERGGHGDRFGEVIAAIDRLYIEEVDAEKLFSAAVESAVSRLDEHSAYLRGADRTDLEAALDQRFGGVGLELSLDPTVRQPIVVSPVFPGPAWRAGIGVGDRIVAIDGQPTAGRPLREAVERLRGPAGQPVRLAVVSPLLGSPTADPTVPAAPLDSRELTLVRQTLDVESVQGDRRSPDGRWLWMLEGEPGVAYVRIERFGERTGEEFALALEQIAAESETRAIILDLRGCPGGLLRSAVAVCDTLLTEGVIVVTRSQRTGHADPAAQLDVRRATAGEAVPGLPVTVLVDGLTASAAEIVAACLQDAGRARIVGSRTFGKGTVQSLIPLSDGRGLLKLTTCEYLRPSREPIHRRPAAGDDAPWGVRPDPGCEVTPTAEAVERLRDWRRNRNIVPPLGAPVAVGSAAQVVMPRGIDAVLARGLEVTIPSP
jgi:carboxyl-terminal processing protease